MEKHKRELKRALEKNCFDVLSIEQRRNGHIAVTVATKAGPRLVMTSNTPGCPHAIKNCIRDCRRVAGS